MLCYFADFFCIIIIKTPLNIIKTPVTIFIVKCSLKNITPINIAVNGSNAPKIAVFVEPMNLIAMFIVSSEIIVGRIESPIALSHRIGLSII